MNPVRQEQRKRVRFCNDVSIHKYPPPSNQKWFDPMEQMQMKKEAIWIAKKCNSCSNLELVGGGHCLASKHLLDATFGNHNNITQHSLTRWSKFAHQQRGLERLVNIQHGRERTKQQQGVIQSVLYAQAITRQLCDENSGELIAQVSREKSINARQFAQHMAVADHRASVTESPQQRDPKFAQETFLTREAAARRKSSAMLSSMKRNRPCDDVAVGVW